MPSAVNMSLPRTLALFGCCIRRWINVSDRLLSVAYLTSRCEHFMAQRMFFFGSHNSPVNIPAFLAGKPITVDWSHGTAKYIIIPCTIPTAVGVEQSVKASAAAAAFVRKSTALLPSYQSTFNNISVLAGAMNRSTARFSMALGSVFSPWARSRSGTRCMWSLSTALSSGPPWRSAARSPCLT